MSGNDIAITRARRQVYQLAEGGPPSSFVGELMHGRYDVNVYGRLPQADVPCPLCKEGRLERRENPRSGSTFYGCSNYPYYSLIRPPCPSCGIGLTERLGDDLRCRDCGEILEPCPDCDGWLETSMGRYGWLLGVFELAGMRVYAEFESSVERGTRIVIRGGDLIGESIGCGMELFRSYWQRELLIRQRTNGPLAIEFAYLHYFITEKFKLCIQSQLT